VRRAHLDALRGAALVLMVLNHTTRWWMDGTMRWGRYWLIYATMALAAPIFLFLVGYCLAISVHRVTDGGATALLRRSLGRGIRLVLAGWLLNALVFPHDPVLSGGVLQTIGLSIIVLAPAGSLLRYPAARAALLAGSVALYAGFALAHPALTRWVDAHPAVAQAVLLDFPLWPWLAIVTIGLVLGTELEYRDEAARARSYRILGWAGLAVALAVMVWESTVGVSPALGFMRDFTLNHHWTPRPMTALWILGVVLASLAGSRWIMEVKAVRLPSLVTFGQTAFVLYFVHQLVVYSLVREGLGLMMNDWAAFAVANAVLLSGLVVLARWWLALRQPLRESARTRLAWLWTRPRTPRSPAPPPARTAA
jgi:uncharacterized membrane protein